MPPLQILVVEDEIKLAAAIKQGLDAEHYVATVAATGEDALRLLNDTSFSVVVLDLGLPGRDGIDVLRALRQRQIEIPVIILSARDTPQDRVLGLDSGADDYLIKPFEFAELVARIRAVCRRAESRQPLRFQIADVVMDLVTRTVTRAGVEVELTNREFQLLECLFRHLPHPVSRRALAREVWKGMERATPLDNVIDVHIGRLRHKLDAGRPAPLIRTIRGVGFILDEQAP